MAEVENPGRAAFLEHLQLLDRLVCAASRRHGWFGDDANDFASWVKVRIIESDYALFRKFRGQSTMGTYLAVSIAGLARDYHWERDGRWRPSAEATRQGEVAMQLERLVRHRGYTMAEAGEQLRTSGQTSLTDGELARILARLPERPPLRPVQISLPTDVEPPGAPTTNVHDDTLIAHEDRARIESELDRAIAALPVEDRLILRMRFWENMTVADIARGLRTDPKPIYRRLEKLLAAMRGHLVSAGLDGSAVRDLVEEPTQ